MAKSDVAQPDIIIPPVAAPLPTTKRWKRDLTPASAFQWLALGWQDTPLVEDLQERAGVFGGVKLERDGTQYAVTWHRSRTGYKVIVLRPAQ